jgi:hypothetical protein
MMIKVIGRDEQSLKGYTSIRADDRRVLKSKVPLTINKELKA